MEANGEEGGPALGEDEPCKQCDVVRDIFQTISLVSKTVHLHAAAVNQLVATARANRGTESITLGVADVDKISHHLEDLMDVNAEGLDFFRQKECIAALGADALLQIDAQAEADAQKQIDVVMSALTAAAAEFCQDTNQRTPPENGSIQNDQRDTIDRAAGDEERSDSTTRSANATAAGGKNGDVTRDANVTRVTRSMAKSQQGSDDENGTPRGGPDQNDHAPENAENQEANQEGGNSDNVARKKGKEGKKGGGGGKKGGRRNNRARNKRGKKQNAPSNDDEQHLEDGSGADGDAQGEDAEGGEGNSTGEQGSDSEARFTLEHYDVIDANYESSTDSLVVADTHLNGTIPQLIDKTFDSSQPDFGAIELLARNYALVLASLRKYSEVEADHYVKKSEEILNDALPALSGESTLGALLCAIPEKAAKGTGGEESGEEEESTEDEGDLARLLRAIHFHDNSAATNKARKVTKERLREVLTVGHDTRRNAKHLFHASLQHGTYCNLTVDDIFSKLSRQMEGKMKEMKRRVRLLAKAVDPNFRFDIKRTTVAKYVEKIVLPAPATENHWAAAARVISDLHKYTTETSGDSRCEVICGGYRRGELRRVDGSTSETGVVYCSNTTGDTHTTRRKVACTTYWLFVVKAIMERLGLVAAHFPYGYTESVLLLAPSVIGKEYTFILSKMIVRSRTSKADAAKLTKLTDAVEAERNDGKRIVVIDSEEQLECLRALAISE